MNTFQPATLFKNWKLINSLELPVCLYTVPSSCLTPRGIVILHFVFITYLH